MFIDILQRVLDFNFSSKGKTPWMSYNGKDVADSQLCIEHLLKMRKIDPDSHLSPSEKGVAWALQIMAEDHLYW